MVSVGATTLRGGTSTRGKSPPQGGAAHGARAHHRGAHNTAGGSRGAPHREGTSTHGGPSHPPTGPVTRLDTAGRLYAENASKMA